MLAHPWRGWLVGAIYVVVGVAFVGDMMQDELWAFGIFYIPLICTAVFLRSPRSVWWLATLACFMVGIGFFLPNINANVTASIVNRLLSVGAILATTILVWHARGIQERLGVQTMRAKAADRLKTEIFANLSHELRTPLNAIIGFSDLLLADCRPDQRAALEHVRSGGHRLLATMENLLDLTQLPDRTLRVEPVNVAAILRQSAEAARPAAAEQGVSLVLGIPEQMLHAEGDAWAMRRIADNLIGNAVKFTDPGGTVTVALEAAPGQLVMLIDDTGRGMTTEVLRKLGEPFFQADAGVARSSQGMGTGLSLCRRLAEAMGATLDVASEPGRGTTVRLRLPAGLTGAAQQ